MNNKNWMLILTCFGIAFLILYRAYIIPFTHDESSTWLNLRYQNVWGCFFTPACWKSANNHWLNTILLQLSGNIGGELPLVLRMPNVLAGWSYVLCAALLVTQYLKNHWSQLFGFSLVTFHFYLLDFFSLARGYGLMVACVIWAAYCLLQYSQKIELKWLLWMIFSLFLSLLANFTALISVASILSAWFIFIIFSRHYNLLWIHGKFILLFSLVCFFLFRLPLKVLSKSGEFEWGADGVKEMGKDLTKNLYSGVHLIKVTNFEILWWIIITALLVCLIFLVVSSQIRFKPQIAILFLLLGLVFAFIVVFQLVTDTKAPIGRKSIFLIPFLFTPLALSQNLIKRTKIARIVGLIGSIVILSQFLSVIKYQINYSREWYYDAFYPELLSNIVPKGYASDSVKLGVSWVFVPSLTFYQKSQSLPISELNYQKELEIDSTMEYYYLESSDTTGFSSSPFIFEKMIGPFYLFKKKHD